MNVTVTPPAPALDATAAKAAPSLGARSFLPTIEALLAACDDQPRPALATGKPVPPRGQKPPVGAAVAEPIAPFLPDPAADPDRAPPTSYKDKDEDAVAAAIGPPNVSPIVLPAIPTPPPVLATPATAAPARVPVNEAITAPTPIELPKIATAPLPIAADPMAAATGTSPLVRPPVLAQTAPRPRLAITADLCVMTSRVASPAPDDAKAPTPMVPPVAQVPFAAAILPALQAFGAAMRRAVIDERRPATRDAEQATFLAPVTTVTPVVAAAGADATPLDLGRERWPHAMIERIDQLRDAGNAVDTRIRLIPDALGTIDVALRREGDTVHVHFTAMQSETRQLLHDAQPRLAEAAEARGLKLGRTEVDGGGANMQGQQQRQPATTPLSARPAPSRPAPTAVTADAAFDIRIA